MCRGDAITFPSLEKVLEIYTREKTRVWLTASRRALDQMMKGPFRCDNWC